MKCMHDGGRTGGQSLIGTLGPTHPWYVSRTHPLILMTLDRVTYLPSDGYCACDVYVVQVGTGGFPCHCDPNRVGEAEGSILDVGGSDARVAHSDLQAHELGPGGRHQDCGCMMKQPGECGGHGV